MSAKEKRHHEESSVLLHDAKGVQESRTDLDPFAQAEPSCGRCVNYRSRLPASRGKLIYRKDTAACVLGLLLSKKNASGMFHNVLSLISEENTRACQKAAAECLFYMPDERSGHEKSND
jgi:hypothetical protein